MSEKVPKNLGYFTDCPDCIEGFPSRMNVKGKKYLLIYMSAHNKDP